MKLADRLKNLLLARLPPANPRDQAIARQAYADFVTTQLAGYRLMGSEALLADMLNADDSAIAGASPLSRIMGAETRLIDLLPDEQIERYYWIVRDRFDRVAPPAGIRAHDAWAPKSLAQPQSAAAPAMSPPIESSASEPDAPAALPETPTVDLDTLGTSAATNEAEARLGMAAALADESNPLPNDEAIEAPSGEAEGAQG